MKAEAVSELDLETLVMRLWYEFLGRWFDGGTHAVGGNASVDLLKAALVFQQGPVPQPLNGLVISLLWPTRSEPRLWWTTVAGARVQQAELNAGWCFLVRAELPADGMTNGKEQVMKSASRLFAVLENCATRSELAGKGILRLRASALQLVSEGRYEVRKVECRGKVRWRVKSAAT
jgi:hypothetical protein